ncbi:MAG TPA: putative Ig domain-containing protein [Planctomycetaceae bacterium]|nr:putative Ig domain-containing protein [Planctomycetaceae bacterium]
MSDSVSVVYVGQTGHVLSAVTRDDEPAGDARAKENEILKGSGVLLRALDPPTFPTSVSMRNQGRLITTPNPVDLPSGLFASLGSSRLTYSATANGAALPAAWLAIDPQTGQLSLSGTIPPQTTKVRIVAAAPGGQLDQVEFKLITADATDPLVLLNEIGNRTAWAGRPFQMRVPDDTFFPYSSPLTPLTFSATGLPTWLQIDSSTGTLSGTPSIRDVKLETIIITATKPGGAPTPTTLALNVQEAPSLQFTIDAEFLEVTDGKLDMPGIISQPRHFRVAGKEKALEAMPDPISLAPVKYTLESRGLHVELARKAIEDLNLWALVRKGENISVSLGKIPKNESATSIAFTLDPTATFDVLLLISGYPPFQSKGLAFTPSAP